jgi:hypothetical protein
VRSPRPRTPKAWPRAGGPGSATSAGQLKIFWKNGKSEALDVPLTATSSLPTSVPGVRVDVLQVFRAFMLAEGGAVDASDKPENPAIRFRVVRSDGNEEHLAFTKFPEFRVDPPEGQTWLVTHGPGSRGARRRVRSRGRDRTRGEGRWITWTNWGEPSDGSVLEMNETRELAGAASCGRSSRPTAACCRARS